MKNKKGFIFVETIVVIAILSIALIFTYRAFHNVTNLSQRRSKWDDSVYLYRTYYIAEFFKGNGIIEAIVPDYHTEPISLSCDLIEEEDIINFCRDLIERLGVSIVSGKERIYLLPAEQNDDHHYKDNLETPTYIDIFSAREISYLRTTSGFSKFRIFIIFEDDSFASLRADYYELSG